MLIFLHQRRKFMVPPCPESRFFSFLFFFSFSFLRCGDAFAYDSVPLEERSPLGAAAGVAALELLPFLELLLL